jgi:nucleoside-diphosphate-sugar epimerase
MRRLWFFRAIASGRFMLIGNGENFIHPVYIGDLVEGMMLAFESSQAAGKTYILGGDRYLALREWIHLISAEAGVEVKFWRFPYYPARMAAYLCERVFRLTGAQPPIYRRWADFFMKSRAYSIALAQKELGYAPKVGLEEGARRTLRWYLERGLIRPRSGG